MQWSNRRQSSNVEDQRGMGRVLPIGGGLGTLVLALAIYFMGGNPAVILNQNPGGGSSGGFQAPAGRSAQSDTEKQFVSVVLGQNLSAKWKAVS